MLNPDIFTWHQVAISATISQRGFSRSLNKRHRTTHNLYCVSQTRRSCRVERPSFPSAATAKVDLKAFPTMQDLGFHESDREDFQSDLGFAAFPDLATSINTPFITNELPRLRPTRQWHDYSTAPFRNILVNWMTNKGNIILYFPQHLREQRASWRAVWKKQLRRSCVRANKLDFILRTQSIKRWVSSSNSSKRNIKNQSARHRRPQYHRDGRWEARR